MYGGIDLDYYEILGVPEDADAQTIKSKYRELARKYHPDVNKEEGAEEKFKEINEANDTLSDDNKRKDYDMRRKGIDPQGGFNPFNFNSWDMGFNPFTRQQRFIPNTDIHLRYGINIENCLKPINDTIIYNRLIMCDKCNGEGGTDPEICKVCNGTGNITQTSIQGNMQFMQTYACQACSGKGKIYKQFCVDCNGRGMKQEEHTHILDLPVGVINKSCVFNGLGNQENKSIPPGRLILDVILNAHPDYIVNGNSCIKKLELDPIEAILGGEFTIKSIEDNDLIVKIPKGCPEGYREEYKQLGIPINENDRGSLFAEVVYKIPKITPEQENLLREYLKHKSEDI